MTGIVVFGHGSSVESANESVRRIAGGLRDRAGGALVQPAFLELGEPDLPGAVDLLVRTGARHILVVPYFLTLGIHLQRDLPRIVEGIQSIHKDVRIEVAKPLDGHPALLDALAGRALEAIHGGSHSESQAR